MMDSQEPTSPEPQAVPWSVTDVVKGIGFFVVAEIALLIVVLGVLRLLPSNGDQVPTTAAMFVAMQVGELVILLAAWRFSVFKYRSGWRSLGFRSPSRLTDAIRLVVVALFVAFLANIVYLVIVMSLDVELFKPSEPPMELIETPVGLAVFAVLAILVAPVAEETFFRGFMFPGIGRKYGLWWGAVGSAALFAMVHFSLGALVPTFIAGLLLAWVYHRTGSIWACIGFHAVYNSLAVIALLLNLPV